MSNTLYARYQQAKIDNPGKYARDLAEILGVSEAELTHARVGQDTRRLQADARTLLTELEQVGVTKSITRNSYAVHEQMGRYRNQHLNGHAGLILNPRELDLRLFLNQWASAFAMSETNKRGVRHSIQFFDHQGDALHKVYTTDETDLPAWMALVERHLNAENPTLELQPADATVSNASPDADKIDQEWRAMTDVHQFFQLLSRNKLTRQQAFSAVGNDLAYRVDNSALSQLLNAAMGLQNEIMIFVGNRGCVQIFTGQIERLMPQEGWINVFNRRFTLHLIEDAIAESWITRKPTKDGFVTSLELFAADGTQIAQLYGQRTEGQPEQTQWREQVAALEPKDIAA
ncbi:Hemin transport protein hemS [Serratia quinivorans]|jgi:putative hemin transport protein|uniref:hemin-degrading factor n=1 Tax=Serratia quinivorans TaxID=137545 RepID=UPI0021788077|nr:ChuX/HutX family heme-like substrate-binding protein [Serratia quinivorans]CAI0691361.1 Hemin transport protein hemS [Serratia quinivorans]CAI1624577.1 Hemin transport protein hemS [Serratia quinivorans]CAI1713657.1 Hemin transport protein hemS [Serratia quinivorans]CAI2053119.1 Hemin transport protein hemS [Serratia quinivorans]CAI2395353.1 Hemin transport protein hemS [Serratia quinivorans]